MNFNEQYKEIKKLAQKELTIIEEKMTSSIQTAEPLKTSIINFLISPSKRVRPVLSILYTKACEKEITEAQLELLTVIELVHNASLIHDDIIDESKFRRGHKSLNEEFDNKLAVIAGDYILSIAMEKIAQFNSTEILKRFALTLNKMCNGEINQNFNRYKIGTIEEYIEKSKNKTAQLFETTLVCCAILNHETSNLDKISKLGINTGIAFQIRDDIINLTKTDKTKPSINDISEGIYNAPIIYSQSVENYSAGIEKTKTLLNNYIQEAVEQIKDLPENKYKKALKEFLELLKYE